MIGDAAELCKENQKLSFVNPDSVYVISSEKSDSFVTVKVSAATRAGGRDTMDLRCQFDTNGQIIDGAFASERPTMAEINDKLAHQLERMTKTNGCIKSGVNREECKAKYSIPSDWPQ